MKVAHYEKQFDEFRKKIIEQECHDFEEKKEYVSLSDHIVNEWSVLPEEQQQKLFPAAAKALNKAGAENYAENIFQFVQNYGEQFLKETIDESPHTSELAALWVFLGLEQPDVTWKTEEIAHTPYALVQSALKGYIKKDSAQVTPELKRQIIEAMRDGSAKRLLESRWLDQKNGESGSDKARISQRTTYASAVKDPAEIQLLKRSTDKKEKLPEKFKLAAVIEKSNIDTQLKFFEQVGDRQATLQLMASNPDRFSKDAFLGYFCHTYITAPERINTERLLAILAPQETDTSAFMRNLIQFFTGNQDAGEKLRKMQENGCQEAAIALFIASVKGKEKVDLPDSILQMAQRGSASAAALVNLYGKDKCTESILPLAQKSPLAIKTKTWNGQGITVPTIRYSFSDTPRQLRAKIEKLLVPSELEQMHVRWVQYAAVNADPEQFPDILDILYCIERKLGKDFEQSMIRAACAGSVHALIDWYKWLSEKGISEPQARLREAIQALHGAELTDSDKKDLDL